MAMTMATCALNQPCQRLRSKRWLGFDLVAAEPEWHKEVCLAPVEEQTPTLPPPSFLAEELLEREPTTANARQLYLVTCQHSAAWMLLTGSLACFAQVSGAMKMWQGSSWMLLTIPATSHNSASWGLAVQLECFVVFRERHTAREGEEAGPFHWRIALKANTNFRFASIKHALYVRHGVASHWSCAHTGYWSAVRYN